MSNPSRRNGTPATAAHKGQPSDSTAGKGLPPRPKRRGALLLLATALLILWVGVLALLAWRG